MGTLLPNARTIYLFIYLFLSRRLLGGAVDLGAEPFVLWSNKEEYWFIGVRQLPFASSSSPLLRFTIWFPWEKSLLHGRWKNCTLLLHSARQQWQGDLKCKGKCVDWAFVSKSSCRYWLGASLSCVNIFRYVRKQTRIYPLLLGNVAFGFQLLLAQKMKHVPSWYLNDGVNQN